MGSWTMPNSCQARFRRKHARAHSEACYPFHPSVLSVFERKWRPLPEFQQTRGVLWMLALWVSTSYTPAYKKAHPDPLLTLGTAPFGDPIFRVAVFEQLGSRPLETAARTHVAGLKYPHAVLLDGESTEAVKEERLHQKVATVAFSNRTAAWCARRTTVPEIRIAVGAPDLDLGNIETALEALWTRAIT